MPDEREFQSVVDEAEQAARAGDFARADRHLRDALRLQEASLGVDHHELASTLNNLAVVSEMLGRFDDAERCYRRANAIASGALPLSDPLVVTSRDNLRDFCAARGLPLEDWPGIGQEAESPPAPTPPAVSAVAPAPEIPPRDTTPDTPDRPRRGRIAGGLLAVAALGAMVVVASWRDTTTSPSPAMTSPASASTASAPADAPVPSARADAAAAPAASPSPAAASPEPERSPPSRPEASPPTARAEMPPRAVAPPARPPATPAAPTRPTTAALPDGVRVVVADVCASLSTRGAWRCEPLGDPPARGRASYYTRIASPRPLRLEHRWYLGTALRQQVPLSVGASPSAGYRTFSRQTLTPGAWRVELRAADGTVLHEAAFDVR